MVRAIAIVFLLQMASFAQSRQNSPCSKLLGNVNSFAAVYYDEPSLTSLGKFGMVVLDPANYTEEEIAHLKSLGTMPFAYLNIAEIETYRSYFNLADTSLFASPDPHWRNRYYADICSAGWQKIVLKERVPELLSRGYCGLFLDLSDILHEFPGKDKCVVALIKAIRREAGKSNLILDGGLGIVNDIGNEIDGLAVEGLMGTYDFSSDMYVIRPDSVEDLESARLLQVAKKFRIKIFQLDYAAAADTTTRDDIILQSRRLGFVPYVGTIELDTLFMNSIRGIKLPKSSSKNPFPD